MVAVPTRIRRLLNQGYAAGDALSFRRHLRLLGDWLDVEVPEARLTRVMSLSTGSYNAIATSISDMDGLFRVVDISRLSLVVDPCCGTGNIGTYLHEHGVCMIEFDIRGRGQANLFSHIEVLEVAPRRWGVAIFSPPWEAPDLYMMQALYYANVIMCHLPGHFVSTIQSIDYRQGWIRHFYYEVVYGLERSSDGRCPLWLIVGHSQSTVRRLLLARRSCVNSYVTLVS